MSLNKKDEDEFYVPFSNIEKGLVLQEKRMFNETPLNPAKCAALLTKALYLIINPKSAEAQLNTTEATDLFFSVTRLFESNHLNLRRLVYLVLKELLPLAEDVIIVFSCLTKDMNSSNTIYRANAIRVLCALPDVSLLGPAERYLKQAIVDKDPYVSSAALVSGMHLIQSSGGIDIVKHWHSEISNALRSRNTMVQYHALGLLHSLRKNDRLSVGKLVSELIRGNVRSAFAQCLLIRICVQVMREEDDPKERIHYYEYLESCLHDKSEIVIYEAARGMCSLPLRSKDVSPAISALQLFLSCPKSTLRFAAIRTLNRVALDHPVAVTACNADMEHLINDVNRSIATLAITTLLKTGSESHVDHLLKQIVSFMSEISDEFKIVVVDAIAALATKYAKKYRSLLNFLSNMLREEGGFAFKKAIVDTILVIISNQPQAKELGLSHLCEFIEDCEYTQLSIKILNLLGKEGIHTSNPSKYIRYIYNRVNLENANVRASAVSSLAKFGLALPHLKQSIVVLLNRCAHDRDDEVRDRATYYLRLLGQDNDKGKKFLLNEEQKFGVSLDNLDASLRAYLAEPTNEKFDLKTHLVVTKEEQRPAPVSVVEYSAIASSEDAQKFAYKRYIVESIFQNELVQERCQRYTEEDNFLETLFSEEAYFKSSRIVELTEAEMEYVTHMVKHVFNGGIIFEFTVTNTLEDRSLTDLRVTVDNFYAGTTTKSEYLEDKNLKYLFSVPIPELLPHKPQKTFIFVQFRPFDPKADDLTLPPVGSFGEVYLKFNTNELDDPTEPEEDEYKLEDIELNVNDYIKRAAAGGSLVNTLFAEELGTLSEDNEIVERFSLPAANLSAACDKLLKFLGMEPLEGTEKVKSKKRHALFAGGFFLGDCKIIARARMKNLPGNTSAIAMEVLLRSSHPDICAFVLKVLLS